MIFYKYIDVLTGGDTMKKLLIVGLLLAGNSAYAQNTPIIEVL